MPPKFPALLALVFLAASIAPAPAAYAVSIYDVIQLSRKGYDGREILGILEATNSVFELTAEDVVRLKGLGVDEAVIEKMLALTPPVPAVEGAATAKPADEPAEAAAEDSGGRSGSVVRLPYHNRAYQQADPHTVLRKPEAAIPPSANPEDAP